MQMLWPLCNPKNTSLVAQRTKLEDYDVRLMKMTFGKYKGKFAADVIEEHPGYIKWLCNWIATEIRTPYKYQTMDAVRMRLYGINKLAGLGIPEKSFRLGEKNITPELKRTTVTF